MALIDLRPVQVETGIIFGQECYLDPARAREFLTKVNKIFPNFFTRYDFQPLPNRFVLENSNGTRRCIVELNKFIYSVQGSAEPSNFLHEIEKILIVLDTFLPLRMFGELGKYTICSFLQTFKKIIK